MKLEYLLLANNKKLIKKYMIRSLEKNGKMNMHQEKKENL